jgi:Zn-finger protein
MPRNPLTLAQTTTTVLLSVTFFMAGCTSFSQLTQIPPEGQGGPQASQCGACHVEQYQEWQGTAHAKAFTSQSFQEAIGSPEDDGCLGCHTPLGIREGQTEARSFHREEGVTCVSCHLSQGKMHGPHTTSALFTPHSVQVEDPFYLTPALCATCHDETYAQWQKIEAGQKIRSCQGCHQAEVQRNATEGTNVFSNILVSFEEKIPTRSHEISLEKMANFPDGVTLTALALNQGGDTPALKIAIRNKLPHDLPTGTFGKKEIQLSLIFLKDGVQVAEMRVVVSDGKKGLAAGETKSFILPLSLKATLADTLRLNLERHSESHAGRPPIILASKIINSISKAFH